MASSASTVLPSPIGNCVGDHVACKPAGKEDENFWDAYMIVALVCFVLGALLLFAGFIRLIWYFTKPRNRWKMEGIQSLATSSTDLSRGLHNSASKYNNGGVDNLYSKEDNYTLNGVLRYLENKPDGPYICPDFEETPALWY